MGAEHKHYTSAAQRDIVGRHHQDVDHTEDASTTDGQDGTTRLTRRDEEIDERTVQLRTQSAVQADVMRNITRTNGVAERRTVSQDNDGTLSKFPQRRGMKHPHSKQKAVITEEEINFSKKQRTTVTDEPECERQENGQQQIGKQEESHEKIDDRKEAVRTLQFKLKQLNESQQRLKRGEAIVNALEEESLFNNVPEDDNGHKEVKVKSEKLQSEKLRGIQESIHDTEERIARQGRHLQKLSCVILARFHVISMEKSLAERITALAEDIDSLKDVPDEAENE